MLAKLELKLSYHENINRQMASSFHGVLMDFLPQDYAAELHASKLHPYAQHLEKRGEDWYWVIAALNEETVYKLLKSNLINLNEFTLKKHNIDMQVLGKSYYELPDAKLADAFYNGHASRYITVQFITPTAFKQNGRYVNYPDVRAIFSNLMNRYDAVNAEESMCDDDTLDQLVEKTTLSRYNLHSTVFCLEGVRIPAFLGQITLRIDGAQTMANFANMLFQFGTYSGIGIKTSIGMGAIQLIEGRSANNER